MNIDVIRKDFPILKADGSSAYLDSAATSLTPEPVLEAMNEYYRTYRANIHRGLYKEAERATKEYEDARQEVAQFIGAEKDEVIFTAGATHASNMLCYSLEQADFLEEGDEVVTTFMEHHALLLPLLVLAKRKKLLVRFVPLTAQFSLDYTKAEELITEKTKLVALTLVSNVLGTINNVAEIARLAHRVGACVVVDATAGVGHFPVNVHELDVDFLFFSGHKMCGPTGVGVLYGTKTELSKLRPSFLGGGIIEDVSCTSYELGSGPESFEAGTPNIAGVIGLKSAVEYIQKIGLENIQEHCQKMLEYAYTKIQALEGVTMYTPPLQENAGILSFVVDHVHSHDMAEIAGNKGVAVRAGHHCALPLHKELNLVSTTRTSVYLYTTEKDIDALISSIKEAQTIFAQG